MARPFYGGYGADPFLLYFQRKRIDIWFFRSCYRYIFGSYAAEDSVFSLFFSSPVWGWGGRCERRLDLILEWAVGDSVESCKAYCGKIIITLCLSCMHSGRGPHLNSQALGTWTQSISEIDLPAFLTDAVLSVLYSKNYRLTLYENFLSCFLLYLNSPRHCSVDH